MFKVYLSRSLNLFFSLDTDPTEVNNVFDKFPSIVMTLLEKLSVYDKNSYPTFYPPRDPGRFLKTSKELKLNFKF